MLFTPIYTLIAFSVMHLSGHCAHAILTAVPPPLRSSSEIRDKQIVRLLGKVPALAAYAYHRGTGRRPSHPNQHLTYAENFLFMLDSMGSPGYKPNPKLARALVSLLPCYNAIWYVRSTHICMQIYTYCYADALTPTSILVSICMHACLCMQYVHGLCMCVHKHTCTWTCVHAHLGGLSCLPIGRQ